MSDNGTRDLAVTRSFDAPVSRVFRAWADPTDVMRWWGPTGFTCPRADMDFREGGASLVCMRAPAEFGGMDMYNTWSYRRIEQDKLIEFVLRFTDQDGTTTGAPPGVPTEVRHVITFEATGDNRTEMTVTEYGYTSDEARDLSRGGLEQCLDKMAAMFAGEA